MQGRVCVLDIASQLRLKKHKVHVVLVAARNRGYLPRSSQTLGPVAMC